MYNNHQCGVFNNLRQRLCTGEIRIHLIAVNLQCAKSPSERAYNQGALRQRKEYPMVFVIKHPSQYLDPVRDAGNDDLKYGLQRLRFCVLPAAQCENP